MARKRNTTDAWKKAESDILAKLDVATEYAALGVQIVDEVPNKNGWLSCYAVGRDDVNPSAAINTVTGRYLDSGGDGLSLALWNFAAQHGNGTSWQDARAHYAAKVGVKLPSDDPPKDPAAHLAWKPWNERLVSLWCRHKPGVTPEAVKAAGGRVARYYDQFTVVALPTLGEALNGDDPVGWVLWNVNGADLPVYHGKGKKPTFAKMKTSGGGDAGLIGIDGLRRIANLPPEDGILWFVEGPTDLLALWSAIPEKCRGTHIVLTNAGGSMQRPRDWMAAIFAGRRVAVVRDADTAGEEGGKRWSTWISNIAAETRWVKLPYQIEPKHGKDLRDFFSEGHTYFDLLDLADQFDPIQPLGAVSATEQADFSKHNGANQGETALSDGKVDGADLGTQAIEADDDPYRLARLNLERYATRNDGRTLRYWREEWYVWKQNRHKKISEKELRAKLVPSIKAEFDRLNIEKQQDSMTAGKDGEQITTHKITMALVSNVLQATSGMVVISGDTELGTWLPTKERKHFISMANGILDVDQLLADADDVLLPNSPKWFSTVSLPYDFDPEAICPKWEAFLEHNLEFDPERIKLLQEWAGYCLLPDTGEQKFLLNEGEGANGKSVFAAGLTALLGDDNVSNVPLELFGVRFTLTDTLGKLLNVAGDCGEIDFHSEGLLRQFTGGDRMFFDRKGVPGINCRPTARLMIACNDRPRFRDKSNGIWRRMLLVPWRVEIEKERRIRNMDKPAYWKEELPGMFLWAIAGLARLRSQGGFTKSEIMDEALAEYREEMNPARTFLKDNLEKSDSRIRSSVLYSIYKKWAHENGYQPLSERTFGKEVRRTFSWAKRKYSGSREERFWVYEGVAFSQDEICGEKTEDGKMF
ncbi:phage/plasmid primase, P4 family [Trichococcus shcherbakoviae]|uniref:phage/plasmid primase, P4 family n=1 Tax=Trichococcus shcherbakoviae TaxID=2094020 RepID=UPI002AA72B58|nr:phage/plasmid primase, P4 family [Trichococcus shcherbakoviae]